MNKPMTYMIILLFVFTVMILISRQQHILPTLLILESLMLFMVTYIPLSMNKQFMNMSSSIIIMLTMSVSSASMGMAMMVMTSRKEGNDCSTSQNMYSC